MIKATGFQLAVAMALAVVTAADGDVLIRAFFGPGFGASVVDPAIALLRGRAARLDGDAEHSAQRGRAGSATWQSRPPGRGGKRLAERDARETDGADRLGHGHGDSGHGPRGVLRFSAGVPGRRDADRAGYRASSCRGLAGGHCFAAVAGSLRVGGPPIAVLLPHGAGALLYFALFILFATRT